MRDTPLSLYGFPPEALDEAFRRAQAELRAAVDGDAHPIGAEPVADRCRDFDDEPTDRLLDGGELLHVVREPLEWLLTLAHRLASDDGEHVAAVDRLRATFHGRLAGRPIAVRRNDALIAFGLLVGALDATVVRQAVTKSIADGVATILACEGAAIAAQLIKLADSLPVVGHRAEPSRPRRCRSVRPTPL
jgi:hypothetical protein